MCDYLRVAAFFPLLFLLRHSIFLWFVLTILFLLVHDFWYNSTKVIFYYYYLVNSFFLFLLFFFFLASPISHILFSFHAFDISLLQMSFCFLSCMPFSLFTPTIPLPPPSSTSLSYICNSQKNCLLQQSTPSSFAIGVTILAKACFFPFQFS